MLINFRSPEGCYCRIKFILQYTLSLMNTNLSAALLVQLTMRNHYSKLQNQLHFLDETVTQHYYPTSNSFARHTETVLLNIISNSTPGAVHSKII